MNVTGIIAEYNPFHNGHLYQLQAARKETDADYIIVVLSGDFVQRGSPAIIDKYARTRMALEAGADLVLELPVYAATSSSDYFAKGAVSLLDKLGVVNCLSFGSEHGNITDLIGIASLYAHETPAYSIALNQYLVAGNNYSYAHSHALMDSCQDEHLRPMIESIMQEPNNTLGIAYIKAMLQRGSLIMPHTVSRIESGYHDRNSGAYSATSVRSELMRTGDIKSLDTQVPDFVLSIMKEGYHKTFPIIKNDFSGMLLYRLNLLQFEKELNNNVFGQHELTQFVDISTSLARRIEASFNQYESFKQFAGLLKSRNFTYTNISRGLIHVLLDITKSRMDEYIQNDFTSYARILGFKKSAQPLLSEIKQHSDIPLISKLKDATNIVDENALCMLKSDIFASNLYEQIASQKFAHPFRSELSQEIIRID